MGLDFGVGFGVEVDGGDGFGGEFKTPPAGEEDEDEWPVEITFDIGCELVKDGDGDCDCDVDGDEDLTSSFLVLLTSVAPILVNRSMVIRSMNPTIDSNVIDLMVRVQLP